ncbi:B-cell receptor-associated 31-like protein [Exidia glandulosa HHB12029]|uniref:Endoplasmic reticulum transmembrane protein n=1 Tax=Exidia glandulosa HHB12029 TaxID=1314781 RepID=A0A165Q614_EXIGL|nr:B-cell receptor-associated 31-like protein [Exidia glandulosa HHB12029]
MTIYYTLTFFLLAAEMGTFCIILAPLPFMMRKRMLTFLSTNFVVAKIAYGLKISFIFIAILFIDAIQRMWRIVAEGEASKKDGSPVHDVRTETNLAARKFYAQRNTYLTGFCLFLSLLLTRTFYILLDHLHTQEEYAKLKKQMATSSKEKIANGDGAGAAGGNDVVALKKRVAELEAKERDFETLKKQSRQQAEEYDRLARELNKSTGGSVDKKY